MKNCPFCYDNIKDRVVANYTSVVAIQDSYPVTDGHLLIVPKRHMEDYFSMNETEKMDIDVLIMELKNRIIEQDREHYRFVNKVIAFIEASSPFYTFQKLCRKYYCISHNEFQAFRFPFL